MEQIFEKACAKINICLDIVGIRDDGYHEIRSVMQCVAFGDDVIVGTSDEKGIHLSCSDPSLPTDEKNLAYRAALAFFEYTDTYLDVDIYVKKNIPDKAGLAGGSADAAAVLRAVNRLSGCNLSDEELRKIAEKIGSDVVFCVSSDPSFVSGRGEIIEECMGLPDCFIVLAKSDDGMKTPEAYRALDGLYGDYSSRGDGAKTCRDAMCGELSEIKENMFNIFESVIIPQRPAVQILKDSLYESGALFDMMSGSGSAVFGIFEDEEKAFAAEKKIKESGAWAVVCRPLS